ncbi:lipopolysaccharide biosynthesis protein [Candidatus Pacearchaeota archaeon]|nr:lipopolysaccharide biosynthesis protein [Candidatus Pacearchaeota archaeon]
MLNTVVASLLGFIFWTLAARFYSPENVGLAAALISATTLISVFSTLGFNFTVVKYLPKIKDVNIFINSFLNVTSLVSLILALVFLYFSHILSPALLFVQENLYFTFSFLFFAVIWTISPLIDQIFIAKLSSKFVFIRNTIFNTLKIPLAVYFAALFGSFGIFASWGIAMTISSGFALCYLIPKLLPGFFPSLTINKSIINNIINFSLGNYMAYILFIAPSLVLPLIIVNFLGAKMNAYFYIVFMIAELLFIIPRAVSQSLFAEGSNLEENLVANIYKSIKTIFFLLIPGILVLFIFGDKLLLLFGAEYSREGVGLLRIFAISSIFLGCNLLYQTLLRLKNMVMQLIIFSGFFAFGILFLSIGLLIETENILSIGYSWLIVNVVLSFYSMWSIYNIFLSDS